jgi:ribonuclease HI
MILLYTDGACSGNNQPDITKREMRAVVTSESGQVLMETSEPGGSNNIAELMAVRDALVWANENGHTEITIRTDSRNNLAWVKGRIGDGISDRSRVTALYREIVELRDEIEMSISWVPREENLAGLYFDEAGLG